MVFARPKLGRHKALLGSLAVSLEPMQARCGVDSLRTSHDLLSISCNPDGLSKNHMSVSTPQFKSSARFSLHPLLWWEAGLDAVPGHERILAPPGACEASHVYAIRTICYIHIYAG